MKQLLVIFFVSISISSFSQIYPGLIMDLNLYKWNLNPKNTYNAPRSRGSILGVGIGPRVWIGSIEKTNLSFEGKVNFSPWAIHIDPKNYTGLGLISFPVLIKISFPVNEASNHIISVGGGLSWWKTDLYLRGAKFSNLEQSFNQDYTVVFEYWKKRSSPFLKNTGDGFNLEIGFNPNMGTISSSIGLTFVFPSTYN